MNLLCVSSRTSVVFDCKLMAVTLRTSESPFTPGGRTQQAKCDYDRTRSVFCVQGFLLRA